MSDKVLKGKHARSITEGRFKCEQTMDGQQTPNDGKSSHDPQMS